MQSNCSAARHDSVLEQLSVIPIQRSYRTAVVTSPVEGSLRAATRFVYASLNRRALPRRARIIFVLKSRRTWLVDRVPRAHLFHYGRAIAPRNFHAQVVVR